MTAPPNANNPNFLLIGERFGLFILSVILKNERFFYFYLLYMEDKFVFTYLMEMK